MHNNNNNNYNNNNNIIYAIEFNDNFVTQIKITYTHTNIIKIVINFIEYIKNY